MKKIKMFFTILLIILLLGLGYQVYAKYVLTKRIQIPYTTVRFDPTEVSVTTTKDDGKTATVNATAKDNGAGVVKYEFYINDELKETITTSDLSASYSFDYASNFGTTYDTYVVITDSNNATSQSNTDQIVDYTISTKEEMELFRDSVNSGNTYEGKNVYLTNDIMLNVDEEWEPIGPYIVSIANSNVFKGIFDGGGYTVDGIRLTTSNYQSQGLFGVVSGGTIKNLTIGQNCIITGESSQTGAITGLLYNNSTMYNCSNNSNIVCENNMTVGGLIGVINNNATVTNCYNTGNIEGSRYIGGIVGNNMTGIIDNCYNTGNITATSNNSSQEGYCVGGIVGQHANKGKVLNCYNTGEISGRYVGGVTGKITTESSIENCYNIGKMTDTQTGEYIAGIVNYIIESKGSNIIKNNYYLENTVNEGNDTKIIEGISNKSSDELKQLYSTLGSAFKEDTNNINQGYPILSWQ